MDNLKCNRCKHEWNKRFSSIPKECPNCKSYKWSELK